MLALPPERAGFIFVTLERDFVSVTTRHDASMLGERNVFIAHAHQDKSQIVRPLEEALGRRAISCWVDEGQIGPGDSLVHAMNEGLRTSRYVVVAITERFMNAAWAPKELNAALQMEAIQGTTKVVPLLLVGRDQIMERYPLLLDKLWIDWFEGVEAVADRIAGLFERWPAKDWTVDPPESYVGKAWARVVAVEPHVGATHTITLRWGPYLRRVALNALGPEPTSLLFHKTNPDRVLLHVEVDPPAVLTFGIGDPPDREAVVIDEGWERAAGWNFPDAGTQPPADATADAADRLIVAEPRPGEAAVVYHVRVARMLRQAQDFNLTSAQLTMRYVRPWRAGQAVHLRGRAWDPRSCKISIYRGPRLTEQQRSIGRGWKNAMEFGDDITDATLRPGG